MKIKTIVGVMALFPIAANAQMVPAIDHTASISIPHDFSMIPPSVELSDKDRKALDLVNKWKKNPEKPKRGPDGSVTYLYGATMPTLIYAPSQVCAVKLQPGEEVDTVTVGDQHRWEVTAATTGSGPSEATTAIIKTKESGLKTSLIITTDRRIYTIKLVSTKNEWIPVLEFDYPDDTKRAWENYRTARAKRIHATTLPTGESIEKLDFGFRMSGDSPRWKPKRVYADLASGKVFIQFPSSSFLGEIPVLVALGKDGGWFSDPPKEIVNYRRDGDRFVVDGIPERMMLIPGVGKEQTSVTIDRVEEE